MSITIYTAASFSTVPIYWMLMSVRKHRKCRIRVTIMAVAVTSTFISLGCGPSGPNYPHAKLEGDVTLDGVPVESGRINFMPVAGTKGAPTAGEITDGHYVTKDVPLGKITVTFSITQATGKMITEGDREPYPEIISIVPSGYAQGIPLEVSGDNAAQDFALNSMEETR